MRTDNADQKVCESVRDRKKLGLQLCGELRTCRWWCEVPEVKRKIEGASPSKIHVSCLVARTPNFDKVASLIEEFVTDWE